MGTLSRELGSISRVLVLFYFSFENIVFITRGTIIMLFNHHLPSRAVYVLKF